MKKSRFSEEQIIGFLRQAEAGIPIKELCRCNWHARSMKVWSMDFVSDSLCGGRRLTYPFTFVKLSARFTLKWNSGSGLYWHGIQFCELIASKSIGSTTET